MEAITYGPAVGAITSGTTAGVTCGTIALGAEVKAITRGTAATRGTTVEGITQQAIHETPGSRMTQVDPEFLNLPARDLMVMSLGYAHCCTYLPQTQQLQLQ